MRWAWPTVNSSTQLSGESSMSLLIGSTVRR